MEELSLGTCGVGPRIAQWWCPYWSAHSFCHLLKPERVGKEWWEQNGEPAGGREDVVPR